MFTLRELGVICVLSHRRSIIYKKAFDRITS